MLIEVDIGELSPYIMRYDPEEFWPATKKGAGQDGEIGEASEWEGVPWGNVEEEYPGQPILSRGTGDTEGLLSKD